MYPNPLGIWNQIFILTKPAAIIFQKPSPPFFSPAHYQAYIWNTLSGFIVLAQRQLGLSFLGEGSVENNLKEVVGGEEGGVGS